MDAQITKIQVLTNRTSGHALYYCHSADVNHNPVLSVERSGHDIVISARQTLFKVKQNPQTKNRVDIYMSVAESNGLGIALLATTKGIAPVDWRPSNANPGAGATGNMQLPDIIWSRYAKFKQATAGIRSGTRMDATSGYINVDFESPHETHIKMKDKEIHLGITLNPPTGSTEDNQSFMENVPETELQRGRNERNPISKVYGDFAVTLDAGLASGFGHLLSKVSVG